MRWSLVPLDKINSKDWHAKMAFHYNCWNVGRFNCNAFDFHRDCNYDRQNEAYSKLLHIPPIYPDGDYVLGWSWYGGGVGSGHFGDYYDCAYVSVQGGDPVQPEYVPEFHAGGGSMHEDGCEATVNDLGICWREPCLPIKKTSKQIPKQFKNGPPKPILSEWYGEGSHRQFATVKLQRLHLIDAKRDVVLDVDLTDIIGLSRNDEISLLAETRGNVNYVEWYTNGKAAGQDYDIPYTIAGDSPRGDFYPWMFPIFNRRMRIAVKVVGKDGTFAWGNVELRFQEVKGSGAAKFPGHSLEDFLKSLGDHTADVKPNDNHDEATEDIGEPMGAEGEDQEEEDSEANASIDDNNIGPQPMEEGNPVGGTGSFVNDETSEANSAPVAVSESETSTGASTGSSNVFLSSSSSGSEEDDVMAAAPAAVSSTSSSSSSSSSSGSSVSFGSGSSAGLKRGKAFTGRQADSFDEEDEFNLAMAAFA